MANKPTAAQVRARAKELGFDEDFGPTSLNPLCVSDEQIQAWIDYYWDHWRDIGDGSHSEI